MKRVAIIAEEDNTFGLNVWHRAIPLIKESYHLDNIWVCDSKFANIPKSKTTNWYLKVFGFMNTAKLGIFLILNFLGRKLGVNSTKSFNYLANKYNLNYNRVSSPNSKEFEDYLDQNDIDILIIMVGHIVKPQIISKVNLGVVNKHAAMLPLNKGMFPYFWAKLHETKQGVSYHLIDEKIDEGKLLFQKELKYVDSMIGFYFSVFDCYPEHLMIALDKLVKQEFLELEGLSDKGTYYSLPTVSDYKNFKNNGGSIIKIRDLKYGFKLGKI